MNLGEIQNAIKSNFFYHILYSGFIISTFARGNGNIKIDCLTTNKIIVTVGVPQNVVLIKEVKEFKRKKNE